MAAARDSDVLWHLKGAKHRLTHSKTVALGQQQTVAARSSKGTAAQKIPGHIG